MSAIPVALFNGRAGAEPYQKRLSALGIPAEIRGFSVEKSPFAWLDVPAGEFERAYNLLLDWDSNEGGLPRAVRCPECKSLRIEYPQYSRKSIVPNLLVRLLTLIGAAQREFYCQDCHYTWPKDGTKAPRRAHMAPYYFIEGIAQPREPKAESA